jgi:hypothetical protein
MKTIKIPKASTDFVWVKVIKSLTQKYRLFLAAQTIEGVKIPKHSTIDINTWELYHDKTETNYHAPSENVNKLLRYIYLEGLRNG